MRGMSEPRISYTSRSDTTPESELSTLANVYRFVLDSAKKNAAGMTGSNGTNLRRTKEVSHVEQRPD